VTVSTPVIEHLNFDLLQIADNATGCYARQQVRCNLPGYENQMRLWAKGLGEYSPI
tara:strand:+ start:1792 stop:1959 length:168 start_codon:yes stop_codon:yes gene_type:complete